MNVLVQRSVLGQSGYPLDQIHIRGIAARGFHGVLQSERDAGQDFSADVTLYLDTRAAARGDDLDETVNYALVAHDVHAILSGDPVNLVETVAERIADAVLSRSQVISVDVTVHKPQAPIPLPFDDVVITIHRDRVNVPVVSSSVEDTSTDAALMPSAEEVEPEGHALSAPFDVTPAPVQLPAPLVVSRVATSEVPVVVPSLAPPVPGPGETALIPRQTLQQPAEPVPAPTAEEIAILDAQARASAALRRPEVFGTTRVTAGTQPDVVLDETVVFSAVRAPVRAGAHHENGPVEQEQEQDQDHDEAHETAEPDGSTGVVDEDSSPYGVPAAAETTTVMQTVDALDRMDARPDAPVDVVIALGGNLGEPQETLRQAVAELGDLAGTEIVAVGPLARTEAVGGPDQPDFLNTIVLARTMSSARELLHACQRIEQAHGRERIEHWGPRTLDVDIIAYGGLIDSTDDLELPHPRAHERSFVLAPWAHVDPDAVLPGLGGGPVGALASTAPDREGIRWLALDWLHDTDEPSEARRSSPPSIAPTGAVPTSHPDDHDRQGPADPAMSSE